MALVGERRRGTFELHAGQPVQSHVLDDRLNDWLGVLQAQNAALDSQTPGQDGEVEHQRGVAEGELGQVNHDVTVRLDGAGKRAAPIPLGGSILVPSTTQYRAGVIELDDPANLHNRAASDKPSTRVARVPPTLG